MPFDAPVDQPESATDSAADEMILFGFLSLRYAAQSVYAIDQEIRTLADEMIRLVTLHDFTSTRNMAIKTQRLRALLEDADLAIRTAYSTAGRMMMRDLRAIMLASAEHTAGSINRAIRFERAKVPSHETLSGLMEDLLLEGSHPTGWWKRIAGDAKFRFVRVLKDAYDRGLPLGTVIQALRGDPGKQGLDGVFGTSRRHIASLIKSAVQAVTEKASERVYQDNSDTIGMVEQISILDSNTTVTCRKYHKKAWELPGYKPVGHDLPFNGGTPRHWGCRSRIVPVFKPFSDLSARLQTRSAFVDGQTIMTGATVTDWTFRQWLERQTDKALKNILGNRYSVWKTGGSEDDVLDNTGNPISIREMRKLLGL